MFEAHQGVKWGSSWQRAVLGVWEDTEMKNSGDAPTLSLKNFCNFGLNNILWMPWLVGWFLLGINSKPPSSLWVSIRRRGWDPLHSLCSFILQFNFKQHSRAEEVLHAIAECESVASVWERQVWHENVVAAMIHQEAPCLAPANQSFCRPWFAFFYLDALVKPIHGWSTPSKIALSSATSISSDCSVRERENVHGTHKKTQIPKENSPGRKE